ncbi:MAG: IMP cyclohydrolase, partial [Candidatus Aenigmarchaeota archaeon]|nr:IMP cyclohydrolase [Candidatus Aenigmarchaeota archaeon]
LKMPISPTITVSPGSRVIFSFTSRTSFLPRENAIRINPIDTEEPFDQFRHYQAVRIDPDSGLLLVSNSQAPNDAIFEAYKFRDMREDYAQDTAELILRSIGPEYDSKKNPTPRIIGVFTPDEVYGIDLGIVSDDQCGICFFPNLYDGVLWYIQTYDGNVNYGPFDLIRILEPTWEGNFLDAPHYVASAKSPGELAEEIYGISDYADTRYGDLRVCCASGIRNGNGPGGWEIAVRNRHEIYRFD